MLKGPFTPLSTDYELVNPSEGEELIKTVIIAEGLRHGIYLHPRTYGKTYAKDYGIDIEVNNNPIESFFLFKGFSIYQVKIGSYKIGQLQNDLLDKHKKLKKGIKRCIDEKGKYYLVLINESLSSQTISEWKQQIKSIIKAADGDDMIVEIITQDDLTSLIETFYPTIGIQLRHLSNNIITYPKWKNQNEMKRGFVSTSETETNIRTIKRLLIKDDFVHVRLIGEPGIGKTRLALEALSDFESLVAYFESPSNLEDNILFHLIQNSDNEFHCILVIDECGSIKCRQLLNKLKGNERIKVITIHDEPDNEILDAHYFNLNSYYDHDLVRIMTSYGVDKYMAENYVQLCAGSPKVAHCFGENLKNNPSNLFKAPDTVDIWNDFISDYSFVENRDIEDRKLVLKYLSLFRKFGYKGQYKHDLEHIFRTIHEQDAQITTAKFQNIINKFKSKRILQGDYTLHISPKALHLKFWTLFWKDYGDYFDEDSFIDGLMDSPDLLKWFLEMFEYSNSSIEAKDKMDALVTKITKKENFDLVLKVLPRLAIGNQQIVLALIVSYLESNDILTIERRPVVESLEVISYSKDLFDKSAKLLLRLAMKENEKWANNSTNIFLELFYHHSKTEADLSMKFSLLEELVNSVNKDIQEIAIKGCDKALKNSYTLSNYREVLGLSRVDILGNNKEDVTQYQIKIWNLLNDCFSKLDSNIRESALSYMLRNAHHLVFNPQIKNTVISFFENLNYKESDKKQIIKELQRLRNNHSLSENDLEILNRVNSKIIGNTKSDQLKRYAGIYLLSDNSREVEDILNDLASHYFDNQGELIREFDWLFSSTAENTFRFGRKLGFIDKNKNLMEILIKYQKKNFDNDHIGLLAGYLRGLIDSDPDSLNNILNFVIKDPILRKYTAYLSSFCGVNDELAFKILELIKSKEIDVDQLFHFRYSTHIKNITPNTFNKWVEYMLTCSNPIVWLAMEIFHSYYLEYNHLHIPKELNFSLLKHDAFFMNENDPMITPIEPWLDVAKEFFHKYPQSPGQISEISEKMIKNIESKKGILIHEESIDILFQLAILNPDIIWDKLSSEQNERNLLILLLTIHSNVFLNSTNKPDLLSLFDSEQVYTWIEKNTTTRASIVSRFVSKTPFSSGNISPRMMLVRYGDLEEVKRALYGNFTTGSFENIKKTYDELNEAYEKEDNSKVKIWLNNAIKSIDQWNLQIKQIDEREFS